MISGESSAHPSLARLAQSAYDQLVRDGQVDYRVLSNLIAETSGKGVLRSIHRKYGPTARDAIFTPILHEIDRQKPVPPRGRHPRPRTAKSAHGGQLVDRACEPKSATRVAASADLTTGTISNSTRSRHRSVHASKRAGSSVSMSWRRSTVRFRNGAQIKRIIRTPRTPLGAIPGAKWNLAWPRPS